jgi:oxygen-independent coproporphyrinogen-3 oxidase
MQGRLPVSRGVALTADDRLRRHIIERLMCDLSVDLNAICAAHGASTEQLKDSLSTLGGLAARGVLSIDRAGITIAPQWRSAARLVCAAFDAYLGNGTKNGQPNFSLAV